MSESRFLAIGERLRQLREDSGLTADAVSAAARISRALLYRYEAGEVVKLDVMERLAELYGTSLAALLGLGNQYFTHGLLMFDHLQRLEEQATQLTIVFGPQAYVLSSDAYDESLMVRLVDHRNDQMALSELEAQRLIHLLKRRKEAFKTHRTSLVNIIPVEDIERYLAFGLGGHAKLPAAQRARRRQAARVEVERLAQMIASPPMGVQIGLTTEQLPTAGFELVNIGPRSLLVLSPFRVVEPINIHYGVATVTEDEQALRLHQGLADRLWANSLRGHAAFVEIQRLLREAAG